MDNMQSMVVVILALRLLLTHRVRKRRQQEQIAQARRNRRKKVWQRYLSIHQEEGIDNNDEDHFSTVAKRWCITVAMGGRCSPAVWSFRRSAEWWNTIVPTFNTAQWVANFRMSEETFSYLCSKLRSAMELKNTYFRMCVPLRKRVAVALWKLATNSEYRTVSHLFGVSITTACRCVQDFCASSQTLLVPQVIQFPTPDRLAELAAYYERRWGLPHCVGAIDGTHIPIIAPQDYHGDYFNRKQFHSIILQAIVDGKGMFWNVNAGRPGSLHDSRVLRLSSVWELGVSRNYFSCQLRNIGGVDMGYYILGDAAYPLKKWLLKPYQDSGLLNADQQYYNRKVGRGRVVVENAFSRLKGRWRCLMKRNDCDLNLVKSMVITCCALHNLCESHGESYNTAWDRGAPLPLPTEPEEEEDEDGISVREAVMRYLTDH